MELVKEGLKIFDMKKPTCLAPDWCHCQGPIVHTCCATGWKLVFAGGNFSTPVKSRYAPVEGEDLAVVVTLYKARHFVLGCNHFTVDMDHKPLLKVLGERQL